MRKVLRYLAKGTYQIPMGWDDAARRLNVSAVLGLVLSLNFLSAVLALRVIFVPGKGIDNGISGITMFLIASSAIWYLVHTRIVSAEYFERIRISTHSSQRRTERTVFLIFSGVSVLIFVLILYWGSSVAK